MEALLRVSAVIDALNGRIGRLVSWLILVAVLISAGNAIIRKAFDVSSNSWLIVMASVGHTSAHRPQNMHRLTRRW